MGETVPIETPSPPPGEREDQGKMLRLKRHLIDMLEKSCGWIREFDEVYEGLKDEFEGWSDSMTLSRYKMYGYLIFGNEWRDSDEAADHLFYYIHMDEEERERVLKFVEELDALKLASLHRIMEVCEDVANTKMKVFRHDLSNWIIDMAYLGYEDFKKAAETTAIEFIRSNMWGELRNVLEKRTKEAEDEEEEKLLEGDEGDFAQALFEFVEAVPVIFDALESEIEEMLVSRLKFSPFDAHHMLSCFEDC